MRICKFLSVLMLVAAPLVSHAQFYVVGDNPASTRWQSTETAHYKIIYPAGLDSLARVYGRSLEKYRPVVGASMGYVPGEYTRGKLPVVIHGFNASSNGSVAWAPKRMNLYSSPQGYGSEPMTWVDMLTLHEQRHVAQMQVGLSGALRPFNYIFGEMFNGLVSGVYSGSFILEGDAVVAETALSRSGRGRTADFLNYYMVAFDHGDMRSLPKWRFGSHRNYYLNEYASGYMLLSGIRYLYTGDIMEQVYELTARRPYYFRAFTRTVSKNTGLSQREIFAEVTDTLSKIWGEEIAARAPYTPYEEVSGVPGRYTTYRHSQMVGSDIWSVRSSMELPTALVVTDASGKEKTVKSFATASSSARLTVLPGTKRIYWSEYGYDLRWGLKINSLIRYYDTEKGKTGTLTRRGRLFNPAASPDGSVLSVTQYHDNGRTALLILDPRTGEKQAEFTAPDSVQVVESAWLGDRIYATGISPAGYGIYSVDAGGGWRMDLGPQPVVVDGLRSHGEVLVFCSDRTGVREFYHFDPEAGELLQKTSSKYGGDDFVYNETGDTLYYSIKEYEGDYLVRTPASELLSRPVNFTDLHKWVIADALSAQEEEIYDLKPADPSFVEFSETKRYRKGTHLFKIHSWAPFYFNVDKIMEMSYDEYYELGSLGAAFLSQNELGTSITQAGYSAHKDPYNSSNWKHSGHLTYTYTGWYPVIEASVDVNDRSAIEYSYLSFRNSLVGSSSQMSDKAFVSGELTVYIPFNFSRGGWSTGFIPQVNYQITNDALTKGTLTQYAADQQSSAFSFDREKVPLQKFTASVRGYSMRPTASSAIYPHWGIGAQAGLSFRPWLAEYYSPMAFFYVYGYAPGILHTHGLSLSVLSMVKTDKGAVYGDDAVNTLPKGLRGNSSLKSYTSWYAQSSTRMAVSYGMPIYLGDISVGGYLLYLKSLELTPHFEYTAYKWASGSPFRGDLYSVGASLTFNCESLFWLKYPFKVGFAYSYNGGSGFGSLNSVLAPRGHALDRHYIGPVFSVSLN